MTQAAWWIDPDQYLVRDQTHTGTHTDKYVQVHTHTITHKQRLAINLSLWNIVNKLPNVTPLCSVFVSPLSSFQRRIYPVAPVSGTQPNNTEFWVTSATRRPVTGCRGAKGRRGGVSDQLRERQPYVSDFSNRVIENIKRL